MRFLSIDKVPFSASLIGLAALLFTDFLTYRPNRIAAGEGIHLLQIKGVLAIMVAIFWGGLILGTLFKIPRRFNYLLTGILSCLLLILLLVTAGDYASATTEAAGSIARISLGASFWISVFMLIVILAEVLQKEDGGNRILSLMILATSGLIIWMFISGRLDMLSIMREFTNRRERFYGELITHLVLVGSSVGLALAVGFPMGFLAHRIRRLYDPTFFALNTLQTIPSLALFGILSPVLAALTQRFPVLADAGIRGIGAAPAIIALTAYSLLPITRNTCTGFENVDSAAVDAGYGMGMNRMQLFLKVEVPIASPIILNGIRVALVQGIGLTAVAALIGAGGLGVFIFQGLGQAANDLILLGAIPTILIALVADFFMGVTVHLLQPRGLR
jgi:osmoprotectant transport system permease protein